MRYLLTTIIIGILFISSVFASPVSAQTFKFELANPSASISAGSSFQVKILINTGGQQTINGDALIKFDDTKVSINSAQSGSFFTYFSGNPLGGTTNKYLISSWEESVARAKSSTTDTLFATATMTAKASGSTSLSFECTPGTEADSNINRASDARDIISCSALQPLTFNIGAAGPTSPPSTTTIPTSTPLPTATPTLRPTNTPWPTNPPLPTLAQLPRSGAAEVTAVALGIGTFLTIIGILAIL